MHSSSALKQRFLVQSYPSWHMVIYDAISSSARARSVLVSAISSILTEGERARHRVEEDSVSHSGSVFRSLKMIVTLSKLGYVQFLKQIMDGINQGSLNLRTQGVVLQYLENPRWKKRYGRTAHDIIIALPHLCKVIEVSTSAVQSNVISEEIGQFEKVELSQFYLYPFFNRAHAINGRQLGIISTEGRMKLDEIARLKFLLRTCEDCAIIASSLNLQYFTPVETHEGLRLAFYFGLVCKIRNVRSRPAPTGAGFSLDVVDLVLEDATGVVTAKLHVQTFVQSIANTVQGSFASSLGDPYELKSRQVFLICAWFLGEESPWVNFVGLLDNEDKTRFTFLAYMNTRRKVKWADLEAAWIGKLWQGNSKPIGNLLRHGDWAYFLQDQWDKHLFTLSIDKNFAPLRFADLLALNIGSETYRLWLGTIEEFFRANPVIRLQYTSSLPDCVLRDYLNTPLRDTTAKSGDISQASPKPTGGALRVISNNDEEIITDFVRRFLSGRSLKVKRMKIFPLSPVALLFLEVEGKVQSLPILTSMISKELSLKLPHLNRSNFQVRISH